MRSDSGDLMFVLGIVVVVLAFVVGSVLAANYFVINSESHLACVEVCRPNVAILLVGEKKCQCDMTKEYR